MRRWVYALTASQIVLTLVTLAALLALYGEVNGLRLQARTGVAPEGLVAPASTLPSLALPKSVAPSGLSAAVTQVSRANGVTSATVLVQSGSPVDLFSVPPLLVDASGKGYGATQASQQAAQLAALDLGKGGAVSLGLDFQTGDNFDAVEVVFNYGSTSAIAPVLRASTKSSASGW